MLMTKIEVGMAIVRRVADRPGGKLGGWGVADSLAVFGVLGVSVASLNLIEEACKSYPLCNPSAVSQLLEKSGKITRNTVDPFAGCEAGGPAGAA